MNELTARLYEPADLPMVADWWRAHGEGEFPSKLLPPLGVIVMRGAQAVAALWLFMAAGCGVCFAEFPVSAPGLSMRESRDAFRTAVGALEEAAKANDYGVMICHTLPPIARIMRGMGFIAENRHKVTVAKSLNHGN